MKDRQRALAVLIAVLLVGVIVGAGGTFFWLKPTSGLPQPPGDRRFGPPNGKQDRPPTLAQILELTPEQDFRYQELKSETYKKLDELGKRFRDEQRPKIEETWDEFNRKLTEILNENQKKKFEKFLEETKKLRASNNQPPQRWRGGAFPEEKR